jgi:hypothetical protein
MLFYLRTNDLDFQWYDKMTGQTSTQICTRKYDKSIVLNNMTQLHNQDLCAKLKKRSYYKRKRIFYDC